MTREIVFIELPDGLSSRIDFDDLMAISACDE
jgi:hypothetical protein